MIRLEHGIVEEDHHAVAGKVLERPFVLDDDLAHRRVVLAQDAQDFFRCRGVAEGSEAAQVRKDGGRLTPMAGEQGLAFGRRN